MSNIFVLYISEQGYLLTFLISIIMVILIYIIKVFIVDDPCILDRFNVQSSKGTCLGWSWHLIQLTKSESNYQLIDFSGQLDDEVVGAVVLFNSTTRELTQIALIDDQDLDLLFEHQGIMNVFIDYEEWRKTSI